MTQSFRSNPLATDKMRALVIHEDEEAREKHEKMGFHADFDQLVALVQQI
jgi:hypothetical protein